MINDTQYIENLCQEIKENGLQPSVGLIRSRAKRKLAVKDVIETLKQWKSTSSVIHQTLSKNANSESMNSKSLIQRVEYLENEVVELKQQLKVLLNNNR